jgi:glycosyltransferase involved in cell wall biosynthesis
MSASGAPYHLAYVFQRFPTFTQTFCVREILELERQGIRPLIFSVRDPRDEPAQSYPESLKDRVVFLPDEESLKAYATGLRDSHDLPKAARSALRYWGKARDKMRVYEAIWIHQEIRKRAPYLRHAHGHFAGLAARTMWWLRQFSGMTFSFTAHANDVFCGDTDTKVSLELLMQDASRVITVSDYTVQRLSREFPVAAAKIRRVYNGLDLEKWIGANHGQPGGIGSRRIYSVGRLIEKKGYDDLIRACAVLRDREVPFTCHIVGGGPLEESLRILIRELRLEEKVFLEGEQNQDFIIEHLAHRAHVFALACVTESDGGMDNLPTVIMEAMAVGVPCVSTRLAGIPEMILEGKTGLITEERRPHEFARCIETLLTDDSLCRRFGQAGFLLAQERFDKSVTTRALKRALVSGGQVRFDPSLLLAQPELAEDYDTQRGLRLREAVQGCFRSPARRIRKLLETPDRTTR